MEHLGADHPIYVLKPGDHQAGVDGDSINMGRVHRVAYLIGFAALTGDAVLKFLSGATAGTKTTSRNFRYRLAGGAQGAASGDVFPAWSEAVAADGLTLVAATYANKLLEVEIDSAGQKDGEPWLTMNLSNAASALNAAAVAVTRPRYPNISAI
jgi:hypothetical protein